jgi:hypothetical protein
MTRHTSKGDTMAKISRSKWHRMSTGEKIAVIAKARKVEVREIIVLDRVSGDFVTRFRPVLRGMVLSTQATPATGWPLPNQARMEGENIVADCRRIKKEGSS